MLQMSCILKIFVISASPIPTNTFTRSDLLRDNNSLRRILVKKEIMKLLIVVCSRLDTAIDLVE